MKKIRLLFVGFLVLALFISCNPSVERTPETKVADGKNLSEIALNEGQIYTVSLSKGSSFTIGGESEESIYSFSIVNSSVRGVPRDSKKERDDLLEGSEGSSVFIAYGNSSSEGTFSSEDFTSQDEDLVLQVCRLNGDTVISYNEVKNARRHGQTIISEAFFTTPEKLIRDGVIDGYEICLSQTSEFDPSNPDFDGHSGYGGRCYGLVLNGKIHSGEEFQGTIDLTPYKDMKIGFFNSVTNFEGGGVSMHLNISSPTNLTTKDEIQPLKKSASVFKITPPDTSKTYALEIRVPNMIDVCDLYTPVISARDVKTGENILSTIIAPSNIHFDSNDENSMLYVYLGKLSSAILCNFSLIGRSCVADDNGNYAYVKIVEYDSSKHGEVHKVSVAENGDITIDGQVPTAGGDEFTIPSSNGMISFIYDNPHHKNLTFKCVDISEPCEVGLGGNITRTEFGGNSEVSDIIDFAFNSEGSSGGFCFYATYGPTSQTDDLKLKIQIYLNIDPE